MITVQSMTLDKEFSIPQNCLEKANFGDKVRIIVKEGEIRLLSISGNIYWHNIGFNDQDWWEYLKTNQIITANFNNQAGDREQAASVKEIRRAARQSNAQLTYKSGTNFINKY